MKSEKFRFRIVLPFAILFTTLAFVSLGCAGGTPPEETWNKTFGGYSAEHAPSAQQTSDGGYILVGATRSYGAGESDFWLVKTDSEGNKEWDRTFGGTGLEWACFIQQTSDGGYILVGGTRSYGAGESDFWLVKTDSNGNKEWDRTYGGTKSDSARSVQQTSDGGYILVGATRSYGAGSNDVWLVKTDSGGNMEWDRIFEGTDSEWVYSVQQTSDNGYILAGVTGSYGADGYNFWLVKTDSEGDKEWDKTFGGNSDDCAESVQQTSDGGYILAGDTVSYGAGDFWLVKTDLEGNKEWDKTFGGTDDDRACFVQQTSDGGYILVGDTVSYGAGLRNVWLIKVGGTDAAPPPAKATELAETSTPAQIHTPERNDKTTQTITVSVQSGMVLATGVMLSGIVFIFFIAYFIRRNYKSKIEDKIRLVIGMVVSFIPGVCLLLISFHYGTIEPFITDLSNIDPIGIGIMAIVYGMHAVVWMWTFIGLKSKYLRAITGYFLFLSSVYCLNRIVFLIAMKISLDMLFLSGAVIASGLFLFCAGFGLIPFFLLLAGVYRADKTGFIKKLRKYLNYLYKEKVLWHTNTKKREEKRREDPKRDKREHKTHKKSAGSAKGDTRPYYYKVLDVSTDASPDEIKKAYRRLSMLYHPDASIDPYAEKKMKEINKAYDVLSDPDKRARYDNFENTFKG